MHDPAELTEDVARVLVESGCDPEAAEQAQIGVTHLLAAGLDFGVTYGGTKKSGPAVIITNGDGVSLKAAAKQPKEMKETGFCVVDFPADDG